MRSTRVFPTHLFLVPIEVQEYALAHSIVEYLESQSRIQFAGFIRSLKDGATIETALSENFDGLTTRQLEADWRSSHKSKLHPVD